MRSLKRTIIIVQHNLQDDVTIIIVSQSCTKKSNNFTADFNFFSGQIHKFNIMLCFALIIILEY